MIPEKTCEAECQSRFKQNTRKWPQAHRARNTLDPGKRRYGESIWMLTRIAQCDRESSESTGLTCDEVREIARHIMKRYGHDGCDSEEKVQEEKSW